MAKGKFFYGWLIVLGGFLIMLTCYPIFVGCMQLFTIPITTDLGITRSEFTLCTSIMSIVGIFAATIIGKFLDKYDVRKIGTAIVLIITADLAGWSFVTQVWQLYALSFVAGFVVIAGTRLLISVLIANWFDKQRGFATGLALTGSGLGSAILTQVISRLILAYGWRTTFLYLAVIAIVFSLPLVILAFRNKPSDIGLKPYGYDDLIKATATTHGDIPVTIDIGWLNVKKTKAFYMLLIAFFFMGLINGGVIFNAFPSFKQGGLDTAYLANVLSVAFIIVMIGKMILGAIFDRFGLTAGNIFGSVTSVIGTFAMLFPATWGPYGYAIFFGFGTCLATVAPPIVVVNEFGKKDLGEIVGVVTSVQMFGMAIGAPFVSLMYDLQGSYDLGWSTLAVSGIVMLALLIVSGKEARQYVNTFKKSLG